jgi:predicted transposase YbfD/YdcC
VPSSLTSALPSQSDTTRLIDILESVPDPRARRGVRHRVAVVMAVGIAAVVAGARSFTAIGEWASAHGPTLLTAAATGGGERVVVPSESAIRRLFARLDADVVDRVIGTWLFTRTRTVSGRRVIAIDGKTVRGARTRSRDQSAPHLVSALDHATGVVLGQLAVAAKSNEIPAVRNLLNSFHAEDLHGCVITVDAMHTQTDTATVITTAGADYVFTVKANQPGLHAQLKALPWQEIPAHRASSVGHGRRVTRTIKVAQAPVWIEFAGAAQVAQVRRTVTRAGKKTVEVVYLITSARVHDAPPMVLQGWVRGHWGIENRLHWCRDVTFDEDRSQVRTGNAPQVMATLRNTAISLLRLAKWTNIAQALRHHARHPDQTIRHLLDL